MLSLGDFIKKKTLKIALEGLIKLAATYFPTWYSSIIGTNGLNFSVRYGKRWIPIVITTIISFSYDVYSIYTTVFYINERETLRFRLLSSAYYVAATCVARLSFRAISTARL